MADKSMKAVISAEVDPRGVVKGVAATTKELEKLNRSAKKSALASGISAGIDAAETAFGMIVRVIQMVDRRVEELKAMAVKYSPEAMIANANLQVAKIQSEIEIAKAVGPGVAKGKEIEAKAMRDQAAKATANAGELAGGAAAWASMKQSFVDAGTAFSDAFITSIGDPSAQGPISAMLDQAKTFDYLTGQVSGSELAGGLGSARGMSYDTTELGKQTQLLEQIAKQTKGT